MTISQQIMSVNGSLLPSLCSQEKVASMRRNSTSDKLDIDFQDRASSSCGDCDTGVGKKRPRESELDGQRRGI